MSNFHLLFAQRYWGAPLRSWLVALVLACSVFAVLSFVRRFLLRRVRRLSTNGQHHFDEFFASVLASLRPLFFVGIGLWVASEYVHFSKSAQHWLRTGVTLLTLFQLGLSLQAAVRALSRNWVGATATGESKMAVSAWAFMASLAIWGVLVVSSLSVLGFQISALLAGLGVGGVAAALAVQNLLGDVFASLSIYFDRPFHIGDFIIVGDDMGTVERVGLRTTRVRSLGGEEIVFANGDLTKSRLHNYKRMSERRVVFGFGVEYTTEYARLADIPSLVKGIVDAREGLRFDRAHFKEYGDFALIFEVVYYVLSPDFNRYMDQQQAINLELFRAFEERGIQFAFPTQKLLLSREAPSKRGSKPAPEAGVDTRAAGLENAVRRGADGPRGYTVSD